MAFKLVNRARMSANGAAGTGDFALYNQTTGFQSFSTAGLADGDTFPYVIEDGANWEIGVGTFHSSNTFSRTTIRASSAGGTSPITCSSSAVAYVAIEANDIYTPANPPSMSVLTDVSLSGLATNQVLKWNGTDWVPETLATVATSGSYTDLSNKPTLALSALTDVSVSEGSGIDGYSLAWNNGAGKWEALAPSPELIGSAGLGSGTIYLGAGPVSGTTLVYNPGTQQYAPGTQNLSQLGDVSVTEGSGINGYLLYFNNGAGKWEAIAPSSVGTTTLSGLSDVNVTEGSGINGYNLQWNNSAGKWEAVAPASGSLSGLSDVNVTEGSGIDGYSLVWNNSTSKWIASNVSGGGGGALSTLSDVTLTSPSNGQVLTYNSGASKWENQTLSGGGGASLAPPTIVQFVAASLADTPVTLTSTPTEGNLLVAIVSHWNSGTLGVGWNEVLNITSGATNDYQSVFVKIVPPSDTTSQSPITSTSGCNVAIWELSGASGDLPAAASGFVGGTGTTQTLKTGAGANTIMLGAFQTTDGSALPTLSGSNSPVTDGTSSAAVGSGSPRSCTGFHETFTSAGGDSITGTWGASADSTGAVIIISPAPVGSPVPFGSWVEMTLGSSESAFGSTVYPATATVSVSAGDILEVWGIVSKASAANALMFISEDGTHAYAVFNGSDGSDQLNYYNGSYNGIASSGSSSAQNWAGLHELYFRATVLGSSDNAIWIEVDQYTSPAYQDTNVNLVGSVTVYIETNNVSACQLYTRVIPA